MNRALRALVLVAAAAGWGCDSVCDVESLASVELRGVDWVDCGTYLYSDAGTPGLQSAHDCVNEAYGAGRAFRVLWSWSTIDSTITTAYVGRETPAGYRLYKYSHDDFSRGTRVARVSCKSFESLDDCELHQSLCFVCEFEVREICCED